MDRGRRLWTEWDEVWIEGDGVWTEGMGCRKKGTGEDRGEVDGVWAAGDS